MFRSITVVLVAALSAASIAAEEGSAPEGELAQVVALNTGGVAVQSVLDEYPGVYVTADGATFVVSRAGDSLAIELPETMALPIRAAAGAGFVLDASIVEIAFDTSGGQTRLIVSRPSAAPVVATRVPLRRGVVTIQDI